MREVGEQTKKKKQKERYEKADIIEKRRARRKTEREK